MDNRTRLEELIAEVSKALRVDKSSIFNITIKDSKEWFDPVAYVQLKDAAKIEWTYYNIEFKIYLTSDWENITFSKYSKKFSNETIEVEEFKELQTKLSSSKKTSLSELKERL